MRNFKIKDEPFAVGYLNADSESKFIRTGCGYKEQAKAVRLNADESTGLPWCGTIGESAVSAVWYGGQCPNAALLLSKAEEARKAGDDESADDYQYIYDQMVGLDIGRYYWSFFTENERDIWNSSSGWGGTWGGHAVPNLIDVAKLGTDGLREKVNHYKELNMDVADFYDGILLTLDAIDTIGERLYAIACEKHAAAENDEQKHKLMRMIKTFDHCPKVPARTFAEAVCVYVMMFTMDGVDSPGHFDWYMGDWWDSSDYEESREALEDLWIFFHNTRTWNLCISGSDENWNDKTNALSYEILDVCAKYKFQTPNLTMRCHRNTPEKLLRAAAKSIGSGTGMPTLYNDEAVCPALERLGICPADAHEYVMNGCNQIDIQGKSHMGLEDGEVNLGMAVEFALFDGIGQKWQKKLGTSTGDAAEFKTFDEFYAAVKAQVVFLIDMVCNMSNKCQRAHAKLSCHPIRSMTIMGCIEKGLDYKDGGPLYGNGQILAEGVPDAIDSIANIKKFVYDDGKYTMAEVLAALKANYEGYEEMYRDFKNSELKFGNDNEYVDAIAKDLIDFYNSYLLTKPTVRGGFFSGGCSPFTRAAQNGGAPAAMANGKKAEEYLYGDSIGATPGCDVNGPTALLSSCLVFDHTLPASGFILNLRFDSKLFNTEKGIEGFLALYHTYFDNKGQQLSVTVVSRDDLLDAMDNPDAHRGLIVRVGGYSEYFVNLPRSLQENIVARTDYEI